MSSNDNSAILLMSLAFATFIAFVLIISALVYFIHLRRRIASEAYAKVGFDACDRSFLNHFVRLKNTPSLNRLQKYGKNINLTATHHQNGKKHASRKRVVVLRDNFLYGTEVDSESSLLGTPRVKLEKCFFSFDSASSTDHAYSSDYEIPVDLTWEFAREK